MSTRDTYTPAGGPPSPCDDESRTLEARELVLDGSLPTAGEVWAVAQAQAVHGLMLSDPDMPPRLRASLVLYAGKLLDDHRCRPPVELTEAGLAAVEAMMDEALGRVRH
jgi:predicted hotdog family 3-hydroxylacyl-ACP dehydratase